MASSNNKRNHQEPPRASDAVDLHYGHPRMPLSERAKIFVPFQALRGLDDALRAEERRLGITSEADQ